MNDKNVIRKIIIIVLIFALILVVGMLVLNTNKNNNNEKNELRNQINLNDSTNGNNKELKPVKSASAYFTVQSCINKYINYVLEEDSDSVYKILDNEYIEKNKVTQENVFSKIANIPNEAVFEANKMYVEEIDENNNKYYVQGVLKQKNVGEYTIEEYKNKEVTLDNNFNIEVILNFEDMIFTIIPMEDGGIVNEEYN